MSTLQFSMLGDPAALAAARRAAGDQRDNLCGPFWARLVVQAFCGVQLEDEEDVAVLAGTAVVRDDPDPAASLPWRGTGPVASSGPYRLALPTTAHPGAAGTSPAGVAHAISVLSEGALAVTPVTSQKWAGGRLTDVMERLAVQQPEVLVAIANIATGHLHGSRRTPAAVLDTLVSGRPLEATPPDWDVGHFVVLAGVAHGPAASLVVACDTYRAFGIDGWHVQEPSAVAAALDREGAGTGGLLVVTTSTDAQAVRSALADLEIDVRGWGNGSPEPADSPFG